MLNLLPQQKKKLLEKEYKNRRLVVILAFISATFIVLLILLTPTFFLTTAKHQQVSSYDDELKKQINLANDQGLNINSKQKVLINLLQTSSVASSSSPTILLNSILSDKGPNIKLVNFSFTLVGDQQGVSIQGIANTREDLIAFKSRLEAEKAWTKVDMPISSLGPATNNQFTMTLTIK